VKSLAGIRARLDELLAAHADENGPPAVIVCLPDNERGPDDPRPFPRCDRSGPALIITYDPAVGQPSTEEVARLLAVQS
jgi:hypothetical protein